MNFQTEYKNIRFIITLEKEAYDDVSLLMGDKFNRLPNQTMLEIKKGNLGAYNILITSGENTEEYTHYLSGVLLTTNDDEVVEELSEYLNQEHILDDIITIRKKYAIDPGPAWR